MYMNKYLSQSIYPQMLFSKVPMKWNSKDVNIQNSQSSFTEWLLDTLNLSLKSNKSIFYD